MTLDDTEHLPFHAYVDLLRLFLSRRKDLVERIQDLLNAQREPVQHLQDRPLLSRRFEDCFFTLSGVTSDQSRLRGQLEEAHWASGFRPRQVTEVHNDLIAPAEMMIRGFYFWRQTRWPGRNGRVRYAETLFNVYLLRNLELLSMRIWDDGPSGAADRLAQVQDLLDELWRSAPSDQPVFVRDARWLIPLTQSPTTDELAAYFEVAEHVAETLPEEDAAEIQKAHMRMIGGHLTSQIRLYCLRDSVSIDESSVVRRTRTSNALDFALLIQGLVPLLGAYEHTLESGDDDTRLELAGAIFQGISPDPEVFLRRVDLLGAYSMIEHLFIKVDSDKPLEYTPMGRRHIRLLEEYGTRISRLSQPLSDDCPSFRPVHGSYSPFGLIYGTPSHLTEHMALKAMQHDAEIRFSLEDAFADGDADKVAWVNGWRQLPHIPRDMQKHHEYPEQFAADIYDRIERALAECIANHEANEAHRVGHIYIVPAGAPETAAKVAQIPDLPTEYIGSSDPQIVAAQKAEPYDQMKLLRDRQEGHFGVSYETPGGWVAIKKDFLTEVLGAGRDAKIVGLPREAAEVFALMCPGLVAPENLPAGTSR